MTRSPFKKTRLLYFGNSLGSVEVHSLTLSYTPGSMKCDSRASLLAHTLASHCLGHEPKVKVVTHLVVCFFEFLTPFTMKGHDFLKFIPFLTIFITLDARIRGVQVFFNIKKWSLPLGSNLF